MRGRSRRGRLALRSRESSRPPAEPRADRVPVRTGATGGARQPKAIAVEGLSVRRGGRLVLDGLSLEVEGGLVTGLLGPSGSGKTTLMRAIVGVQVIESGSVTVAGLPAGTPALRSHVGYVTQAPSLYGDLTVRENLHYFGRIARADLRRADDLIDLVALHAHADQAVERLSGGERARASLATALVGAPSVLILDEPTVGLDPVLRRDLWQTFHRLAGDGATVLVSSHVMDEAQRCDRLILLRGGELIATGSPADLRGRAGTEDLDEAFLRLVERRESAQAGEPA